MASIQAVLPTAASGSLFRCLAVLEQNVRAAVARRRSADPDPDDRFRGLYLSDAHVDRLLDPASVSLPDGSSSFVEEMARLDREEAGHDGAGVGIRLWGLARSFGLDPLDVSLLVVAFAPDVDPRFERLYAYLNDDVSRRRATVGLALELCDTPLAGMDGRRRFSPASTLVKDRLMVVEEPERPSLTRSIRVPDRVLAFLLGDDTPDPLVAQVQRQIVESEVGDPHSVARALRSEIGLCYLREGGSSAGLSYAAHAFAVAGLPWLALDVARVLPADDPAVLAQAAVREARLRGGGGLIVSPVEALAERGATAVRAFAEAPCPVVLVGEKTWDPAWSREIPFVSEAPALDGDDRARVWATALGESIDAGAVAARETSYFRLTPEQIVDTAHAALRSAAATGSRVGAAELHTAARAQNAAGLERLARRVEPRAAWDDLVVQPHVSDQLRELTSRARFRELVFDEWGLGTSSSQGRGVAALFAGESGTGKTMSAEIVAGDLGLDLYVIDLSTVVDKYIGETEKNLERIFNEADRINGVLLFDEADAIFGKRSEVRDAHDRYANLEVAFLLQRMERFDGLAILTSNLRANLDEAFVRRLDSIIDFPMPEKDDRRTLWSLNLARGAPLGEDIDVDFLAEAFVVSGGNIRNIVVTASFLAAEEGSVVDMSHLIRGTEREYRKLGRLRVEEEFGRYYALLR